MKKLLIFFFLILAVPLVYSADYDIDITFDLEEEVPVGEFNLGNIIIEPKIINNEVIPINESTDYSITRGDKIKNKYNHSIKLGDHILVQNEVINMDTYGSYQIKKLDDIVLGYVYVNILDSENLVFTTNDNLFNLEFSDDDITLNDLDEISINVTVNTSLIIVPDRYYFDISYQIDDDPVVTIEQDILVRKFENISVSIINCTKEMPILSHGVFCDFELENTGNVMVDLEVSIDGFEKYFYFPENVGSFPRDKRIVIAYYDLSREPPLTKSYLKNVTFKSDNLNVNIPVNFSFVDKIYPYIRNFSISDLEVLRPYNNTVEVIENYNLTFVRARLYNNEQLINEWDLPKYKFDFYSVSFTPQTIGQYRLEIWAKDRAENLNITPYNFNVNKLNAIKNQSNLRFNKVKFDKYRHTELFYVDKDIDFGVEISQLNYKDNCTWEMNVLNKDTGNEAFIQRENTKITFNQKGNYTIGFKGECVADLLNGQIKITVPNYHEDVPTIIFSGEIIDYNIPDNIVDKTFNDGTLNCDVQDTGEIETSTYRCTIVYPLAKGVLDIMPVSVESYDNTMLEHEDKVSGLKKSNRNKIIFIVLMFIIMGLLILWVMFSIYVYPTLRFRLNVNQKE